MVKENRADKIVRHWLTDHNPDGTWCSIACLAKLLFGYNNERTRATARRNAWAAVSELAGERYQEIVVRATGQDAGFEKYPKDRRVSNVVAYKILRDARDYHPYLDRQIKRNLQRGDAGRRANDQIRQVIEQKSMPVLSLNNVGA